MTAKLLAISPLETPLEGRISRQVKHMPFTTQINIHKASQGINHTLEIVAADRPGLLARVAFIFLKHGVDLHNAKINTLGNRAEDSFLLSAKHGKALLTTQIDLLVHDLTSL